MPDIGDDVAVTTRIRVNGVLTDPATVTATVTSPSGTPSSPTATKLSVGVYQAIVPATEAGRWRYTFATTGPAGEEHGYFDVLADPPPPGRFMPLATTDDLVEELGRDLTDAELARAPRLLRDASARIRSFTRQVFDLVEGDTITLPPVGSRLRLPQRPVLAVAQVVAVGGAGQPDVTLPTTAWRWGGLDEIELFWCGVADTFRVTYDHGYQTNPDFIVAKTVEVVLRTLTAPTTVAGLVQERIGQYAYQYGQGPGQQSPGASVKLTKDDKDDLREAGYKRTASTVQLRTG